MPAGAGGAGDTPPGNVLGGWGSGLNFNWEGIYGINLPGFITIADFGLPVGLGGVPVFQPGYGVSAPDAVFSDLPGSAPATFGDSDLPPEIDRRDQTSIEPIVPLEEEEVAVLSPNVTTVLWGQQGVYPGMSDEEWLAVMFPGSTPSAAPISTPDAQIVSTSEQESDVSWIEDIYAGVDRDVFGGMLPGGATPTGFGGPVTSLPTVVTTPTVTAVPGTPAAMASPSIKSYCYKFVDGQWKLVKMRRHRRKQLATKGDLQDLAALKGILGLGKAFEVWIATHS